MSGGEKPHGPVMGCPSTIGDDFPLNTTTLIRHAARTYGIKRSYIATPPAAGSAIPTGIATSASVARRTRFARSASGDEWISSIDMENALMEQAAVREAAVVGLPHPQWQERPLALVDSRPKTSGGKLDKKAIRAEYGSLYAGGGGA